MSYVKRINDGSLSVNDRPYAPNSPAFCNTVWPCIVLHNGAVLHYYQYDSFGVLDNNHALAFQLDPDGKYVETATDGPSTSVTFFLYPNGRLLSWGYALTPTYFTYNNGAPSTEVADLTAEPAWFNWK